jgi:hypothetical protein
MFNQLGGDKALLCMNAETRSDEQRKARFTAAISLSLESGWMELRVSSKEA